MPKGRPKRSRAQIEEDLLEKSYRNVASKRRKNQLKKVGAPAAIIAICTTVILIAAVITVGCIYFSNANQDGTILDNVSVAGVDVGGMTQAEAIATVKAATENTYAKKAMIVRVFENEVQIPPAVSHVSLNVKAAVKAAYKYGRSGSSSRQQNEQQAAMNTGVSINITKHLNLDSKAIKKALSELGVSYNSILSQTTYEVTGPAPEQKLVIHLGIPEYSLNLDALYEQVLDAYSENVFLVDGECGMIEPEGIDLEAIFNAHYIAPVNAVLDPETHKVIEGIDGYGFNLEKAKEILSQAKYGTTVEIPLAPIQPEITAQTLSNMLYRDKLATYTAANTSDNNRDTNLRLACEAIDGIILNPGDVFSYNDALGERTAARGYKPGPSYSGNETVETIGGGICQVSSSLYYCAMLADLEILVRDAHGFATSYMPLGMDATVSWGSLDFRFRNNTDYPIQIIANASGGNTTVTLMGTDSKDYYVKMEYEVLKTYPFSTSYQTFSADNPQGYQNGDYILEPYTGYDIQTYRCKYAKDTDTLLSKDLETTSNYRKRDGVICKITGGTTSVPDPNPLPGIGNGGVTEGGDLPPELP